MRSSLLLSLPCFCSTLLAWMALQWTKQMCDTITQISLVHSWGMKQVWQQYDEFGPFKQTFLSFNVWKARVCCSRFEGCGGFGQTVTQVIWRCQHHLKDISCHHHSSPLWFRSKDELSKTVMNENCYNLRLTKRNSPSRVLLLNMKWPLHGWLIWQVFEKWLNCYPSGIDEDSRKSTLCQAHAYKTYWFPGFISCLIYADLSRQISYWHDSAFAQRPWLTRVDIYSARAIVNGHNQYRSPSYLQYC